MSYRGRFKISAEHRQELVELYLRVGMKGVEKRAAELGVTPKYVANAASVMGVVRDRYQGKCLRDEHDPRWERARSVGVVVA